jgi:lipopolysaccharide/colanic/teichoic acid biosynthesis glycosyltransferase
MTINSQLVSVKLLQGLVRRSTSIRSQSNELSSFSNRVIGCVDLVQPLNTRKKPKGLSLQWIDGNFFKRLFDVVFSSFVLIFFSPIYLLLAALIAISSPGPIFYAQQRVGKNFKPFKCIKFRTMVKDADAILHEMIANSPQMRQEFENDFKLKKDPRITWIGNFLRHTSLDEFPQFWNVLRGDMSVVGPRPLVPDELHKYGHRIDKVLTIRPGITGLWQVSGRNDIPYPQRIQIDVYYAKNHSWLMDLSIAIKTIGVVVFPRNNGAY